MNEIFVINKKYLQQIVANRLGGTKMFNGWHHPLRAQVAQYQHFSFA
jgi:hypothetical protein